MEYLSNLSLCTFHYIAAIMYDVIMVWAVLTLENVGQM